MSNSIDPDQAQYLIWVETVCKHYQQTTLGGKKLTPHFGFDTVKYNSFTGCMQK